MLSLNKKCGLIILGVILALGVASLSYAFSFTPDLTAYDEADNPGHPGCVGETFMPAAYGYNGWDIDQVGLYYDSNNDILYVGISMWNGVIAGDVENDGDPGGTHTCLSSGYGWDYADLAGPIADGEAIDFVFDSDNDGTYEYIAGVSHSVDISGFTVAEYNGAQPPGSNPGAGYGADVASVTGSYTNNPNAVNPDFEFKIVGFSNLRPPGTSADNMLDFDFVARAGSTVDAGTGEDTAAYWGPCQPGDIEGADSLDYGANPVTWAITNNSSTRARTLKSLVDVQWPSGNGNLVGVAFGGTTIWTGSLGEPATIDSGWSGDIADRILEAGQTKTLELTFATSANSPTTTDVYYIQVEFYGDGCQDLISDAGPTVITLSSFAANSSTGGAINPLWLGLAGLTVLAAGSFFWTKRRGG